MKKLLWWVDPNNPKNPFQDRVKLRNQLIIHILLLTGVREGELLAMRTDALVKEPYGWTLKVTQNTSLDLDPRAEPPQVKTFARNIPIGDRVMEMTDEYIRGERKQRGRAAQKAPPYLLLNSNIKPQPMSYKSLLYIFHRMRKVDPQLFNSIQPYQLRHTFNDLVVLSSGLDVDSEAFKNMQRELSGWSTDSKQGINYTKRAREILASEILQKIEKQIML